MLAKANIQMSESASEGGKQREATTKTTVLALQLQSELEMSMIRNAIARYEE